MMGLELLLNPNADQVCEPDLWWLVQVSDKMDPGQLVSLIATLNPQNVPGRLTVIIRMGAEKVPHPATSAAIIPRASKILTCGHCICHVPFAVLLHGMKISTPVCYTCP